MIGGRRIEEIKMIIVDTNVILSALLTKGITKVVLTAHKDVYLTPQSCFNELWKHREVWNKNDQPEEEQEYILSRMKRYIMTVDEKIYNNKLEEAGKLIIDMDDTPLIALALSIDNEGIWTYNTKHFKKNKLEGKVKILNIKDVIRMYPFELEE
jgi:predicted nucleic acid-binding protein